MPNETDRTPASIGRNAARAATTLAAATVGALVFHLVQFPAAFLAGAMVTTAALAIAGRPVGLPDGLARGFFVIVGISLGSTVDPAALRGFVTFPLSIAWLLGAMTCVAVASAAYLRRAHGFDPTTAILAAVPGALSQVLIQAAEEDCDLAAVAVVQTVRVMILVVAVPVGLSVAGLTEPTQLVVAPSSLAAAPGELAILVLGAVAAAAAASRAGFPAGLLLGPMVVSAALHGSGLVAVTLPAWVMIAGMIGVGAVSGSRFAHTPGRMVLAYLRAALGAFVVAVTVAALFAGTLVAVTGASAADVTVAFSPGAIEAMMVLALALHIDPVFVGAHHLARVFAVSFAVPIVIRRTTRERAREPSTRLSSRPSSRPDLGPD